MDEKQKAKIELWQESVALGQGLFPFQSITIFGHGQGGLPQNDMMHNLEVILDSQLLLKEQVALLIMSIVGVLFNGLNSFTQAQICACVTSSMGAALATYLQFKMLVITLKPYMVWDQVI